MSLFEYSIEIRYYNACSFGEMWDTSTMTFKTPASLDGLTGRYLEIDKTSPFRNGRMIAHIPAVLQGKVCFTLLQHDALVQYVEYVYGQGAVAVLGTGYCPKRSR